MVFYEKSRDKSDLSFDNETEMKSKQFFIFLREELTELLETEKPLRFKWKTYVD